MSNVVTIDSLRFRGANKKSVQPTIKDAPTAEANATMSPAEPASSDAAPHSGGGTAVVPGASEVPAIDEAISDNIHPHPNRASNDEDDMEVDDQEYVKRSERTGVGRQNEEQNIGDKAFIHLFNPARFERHLISLVLSTIALTLTGAGSWDCSYFEGATIDFTGQEFGIWTLQDTLGKCQLWDVLFFSYELGPQLIAARCFSMCSLLVGLGLVTAMAQASQFHLVSWGIGLCLFVLFLVSVSTSSIYNLWTVFFFWTYCIYVIVVRWLFIHPVPRHISHRGTRIISGFFALCFVMNLLTLVVLRSHYCTCENIDADSFEDNRDPGDPCNGTCHLRVAGYLMIIGSLFWSISAVASVRFGVQPETLKENPNKPREMYSNYPRKSIVSRAKHFYSRKRTTGSSFSSSKHRTISTSRTASSGVLTAQWNNESAQVDDSDHDACKDGKDTTTVDSAPPISTIGEEQGEYDSDEEEIVFESSNEEEEELDAEDVLNDDRDCCQKFCCDFRVTPRTRKEKRRFWIFRTILGIGFGLYIFVITLLIGSRMENTKAANEPSTSPYFTTPEVCAFNPEDPYEDWITFPNETEAHARNWTIAHCGNCGQCSNPHDTIIYVDTRETIAQSAKECGVQVYLGTYGKLTRCLQGKIGFRTPCAECWADNMINTGKECLFTCVRTLFSGFMAENNVEGTEEGWLNQCIYCDEKMSGPEFVTCSGEARRRLGIKSEIERNPEQQCNRTDVDWVNVDYASIGFYKDGERPSS